MKGGTGGDNTEWISKILGDIGFNQFIETFKAIIKNINEYMPLNKLFEIIIYIFNFDFNNDLDDAEKINIYIIFIVKFLISAIIVVMPIVLLILTMIKLDNIVKKNKKYWWAKEKYNYLNTKYIFIKKIHNIFGVTLSENILIYLSLSVAFIIMGSIMLLKFKKLIENDYGEPTQPHFKNLFYYNGSVFLILFLIITIFLGINYIRYNRVFKYNKEINNTYIRYLNKDYVKTICNNFIDDDNNITDTCTFKKIPDSNDLNLYLATLKIEELKYSDLDLENENLEINYSTKKANNFISALITHQFLLFIYNNQFKDKLDDNKFCRELKLNSILNNKIDNIFYCYKETAQHPFTANVENELLKKNANTYFISNYEVYTKIIDKYLEINNKLSENIVNIKKENIDEITITILIAILFIFYLIGLFLIFNMGL